MTRKEAEKLVGENVACWTGLRGCYIGRLVEVIPVRPWRGKVEILAVAEYPVQGMSQYSAGFKRRKPAAFGAIWEFGNSSIYEHIGDIPDYRDSSIQALRNGIEGLVRVIQTGRQIGKRDRGLGEWLKCLEEDLLVLTREGDESNYEQGLL